ncbi:MAG TPA: hypothetical protein VMT28_17015 [Terriglobales bacterium]|jgi:hypothetical protein|nr:hypothetical protein [Terriglobales bacterium]
MKRALLLSFLLCSLSNLLAQNQHHQQGTIVRMRMASCLMAPRGFMAALSGSSRQVDTGELCPEYVLVADKVVYVIVGKTSGALVPLAEKTCFRLQKNELLIRIDDANHETRFNIREMVLRSEWERVHPNVVEDTSDPPRHRLEAAVGEEHGH